ncbi:MAG: hypothetical protein LBU37_12065 [Tannerellaceae bacterium]|jgi:hypothetical protein|nr:hypothetical protein [Tannerellaceae bacterium]
MKNYSVIGIIILFCSAFPAFSQEKAENSQESIPQAASCASSYTNQTVSSTVNVYGCSTLGVQNVTVTGAGKLTLAAPGNITINGTFLVNAGGTLLITDKLPPRVITFGYDLSGNMTGQQSAM